MDILQQNQFKALLIGDSCIDKYHYGICDRISPEAPVPVFQHQYTIENEGMVLNVANNLRSFGFDVDVWTNEEKIFKERFVDARTKQHLLRSDFGENEKVKSLDLSKIDDIQNELYDCIIISDYDKGYISLASIRAILKKFQGPIFVDTKKKDLSIFKNCIIKINEKEYSKLTNKGIGNDVIITLGSFGAKWKNKVIPTKKVEISDVSGAGDTFLAALVYGHMVENNLEQAIKCANICASVVVQRSGTYALNKEDLDEICF